MNTDVSVVLEFSWGFLHVAVNLLLIVLGESIVTLLVVERKTQGHLACVMIRKSMFENCATSLLSAVCIMNCIVVCPSTQTYIQFTW